MVPYREGWAHASCFFMFTCMERSCVFHSFAGFHSGCRFHDVSSGVAAGVDGFKQLDLVQSNPPIRSPQRIRGKNPTKPRPILRGTILNMGCDLNYIPKTGSSVEVSNVMLSTITINDPAEVLLV